MAKRKDRTRDGQKLGPAYHIKSNPSQTVSLRNENFGMMARRDKKADKNTPLSTPMDHLRKETPTYTQMYSGKGKNKTKTVQSSWNRNGGKSGNNRSKSGKSGNQPKPMNRNARIMSATLSDSHKRPAIMATDQAKRELEAENDRNNSPMGALRRRARKAQTGQADNYSREDADKRLFSETLSSARKAEKNYKKAFEENRYTGGSKTLLSGADTKNLSEEDQNDVQVWKDEWDKGQRLIDQGYTQKGKQMQAEAHAQAERIRMTEGYSGGESGSDFTTPEIRQDEYAGMSDSGRKNLRVAKSLYEFGQKTEDEELMKQAAQMGQQVRLEPSSYDYKRSEAYHKFAEDRPVTNPNTDAYGRSIYTPNEWEQEQNKKWGTAVGQGLKGGFLTLLETARKSTQNAIKNRYDPEYQSKKYTAEYLQHEANKEQDEREKIRLNAKAAKMRGEANDAKAKENIGTDTPGMQALRASSEATEDLVNNAKTGGGKLLTKAGISMLQMAPFLAANLIPGAGQAISLGGIGALAAGQKAGELQQDNRVSAQEAFARGLVSGGIEAFTEKIPMDSLLKLVKGGGGTNFIKAVAKQAGIEATEESASYTMNWLADKAARDPKAKFSLSDLAENAAIGAISGAAFGAGGHVIGSAIGAGRTPYNNPSPTEDTTPTPTVEEAPRPIQEQPTQESANPLIRASQAQEQKPTVKEQVAEKRWQRKRLLELNEQEQELNERFKSANKRAFSAKTDAEMQEAINEQNEITAERARISNEREELEARLNVPFHPDLQTRTQEAEPVQEPTRSAKERLEAAQQAYRQRVREQAQANQDTGAQMQSARERLVQARQALAQREAAWQERAANATEEEVPDLLREQENLLQEERQIQAQETQAEREDAGQLSRNFGEEAAHIDQRTAGDVSKPSVKAFQWDYPQMHQYYAQAAEALLQDVEYSKAGQFSEKGRGTVVTKSEAMMQAERMGISRADLEKALIAIINDQGQENYATAKKVELVLDEMLSKGYIPNEAGYSANKVDSKVPPNEAYITAKEAIPGAVKRGSFEAYKEQNRLALELGEITEEELYQEWEQGQTLAQSQAQFEPQSQAQTQDTQVQQNTNEIPATFDEYKAQFQDVIDSREMTEGQLLDEYNAIRRRNERLQRRGEPIRRARIEPQYTDPGLRDSLGSARAGFDPYSQAMNRYGTIEPGENPARIVDVPKSMTGSDRVRKTARTFMEAEATSDELVEAFQEGVTQGEWSYTPKKDKDSVERSMRVLSSENGIQRGFTQWDEVVEGNRQVTKDDIVLAEMLYKMASRNGDTATAKKLAAEIAAFGTTAGQNVQAIRLLKKATPEGKLFYVQKVVEKLNSDIAKRNKNKKSETTFTSEEVEEIAQELNDVKDDALRLIRNTIEAFQEGKKGKMKAPSWVEQLGQDLAKNASQRATDKTQAQTPIYQTILSDLNAFMSNYVDSKKGSTQKRTAAERIKDYLANRDEYGRAWRIAQNALREKYAGNQKMLDRLEEFIENGIDYNAAGRDAILGKAVDQAIKESGIDAKDLVVQHSFGDTSISDRLAERLVQETGATGADATMVRDGVNRWLTKKTQEHWRNSDDILNTDIKQNLRDIGVTISDVLKTGSTSRKALANDLASAIVAKHGISKATADKVSQAVTAQFETMLEDGANKKLQSMFSQQDKGTKQKLNKVVELARLGAFSNQNYNELATSKVFQTEGIEVPDELAQKLLDADGQEEMDAALDEIYDYVADRVPKTADMRLDAWRYFAMLGNPRTHMRNVIGNFVMQGLTRSRNATSAALQQFIVKDADQRTRTFAGSMEAHKFAKQDFLANKDLLSGNPYTTSESGIIWQKVREKAFTVDANKREKSAFWRAVNDLMKVPQTLSSANTKSLDFEDFLFKRSTYIDSLANFLTARGYKTDFENIPANVMEEARGHAIDDALEATFQEYSALASKLAQFESSNKAAKLLVGGTFPFKRVPINIAKQGIRYSPAGLLNSMTAGIKKLRNGDITGAEFCDELASGLTGTGVAALGAFLIARGILSAGGDDDDKQSGFDAAMGSQNYAINFTIGGQKYSYTIDWAAPSVVPLFIGAEFYKALKQRDEETSLSKATLDALGRMFEPMMQMTMLSGVSSTIKSAAYSQQDPIYGVLGNVASNYAGQFVPTLLGQIARTMDPVRRSTFYDANSKVPKELQRFLQRQGAKIPGLSEKVPEYLDVWGRNDMGSDNMLLRVVENFLSPGYANKVGSTKVEDELQRLNDAGYEGMLPGAVQKSGKLDGNRMTADQWMKRQKEQGSTAYEIMQNFIGTQEYQNLTDDQKAKFIDKAYEYAKNSGKAAAGGDTSDFAKWYEAANNAQSEAGLSKERFLSLYAYKSAIEDEAPDEAKASLKQGMWEEYINGLSDLSQEQKDYVLDNVKFWQMMPADSGAYQKAKNAGYDTPEAIQALLEAKSSFSTDGNNDINNTEMYKGIIGQTSDPAEQEKMYNAIKDKDAKKSWKELAAEQSKQAQVESTAQAALDKAVSKDKQTAFATAMENAAGTKQTDCYRALTSTGASEAECKAYFAYISAQKGWKKSWEKVKADALKGK